MKLSTQLEFLAADLVFEDHLNKLQKIAVAENDLRMLRLIQVFKSPKTAVEVKTEESPGLIRRIISWIPKVFGYTIKGGIKFVQLLLKIFTIPQRVVTWLSTQKEKGGILGKLASVALPVAAFFNVFASFPAFAASLSSHILQIVDSVGADAFIKFGEVISGENAIKKFKEYIKEIHDYISEEKETFATSPTDATFNAILKFISDPAGSQKKFNEWSNNKEEKKDNILYLVSKEKAA